MSKVRESAMKGILIKHSPGSSQDTDKYPVEVREELGMFKMHGDTVPKFVL